MFFTNMIFYVLPKKFALSTEELGEKLKVGAFTPCGGLDSSKYGFVSPLGRSGTELVHAADSCIMICARHERDALKAELEALSDKALYVPISADMKSVFIDGFGLLPIQYEESEVVSVPDGWKLVPVEPTKGMLDAAWTRGDLKESIPPDPYYSWKLMLSAAPAPPSAEQSKNQCALNTISDEQVRKVARAFWRRIYCYRNDYGIELPTPIPIEFMAHMATALTWVDAPKSDYRAQRDELILLIKECRATFEMWKDVAPAISLCKDLDAAIAKAESKP